LIVEIDSMTNIINAIFLFWQSMFASRWHLGCNPDDW